MSDDSKPAPFAAGFFDRQDESDDALFYKTPRFVVHIDAATIAALTEAYRELLEVDSDILDLMSSWVSHLPDELQLGRVAGLGMNDAELAKNPRLSDYTVQDLNREPELPYADASFDAVLNAVSIQYLTRPVEVFRSAARVLRPGGFHAVAMSHRCFPTKAIRAFQALPPRERMAVVRTYFVIAGGYDEPAVLDFSPSGADPLWIVLARRQA
jgi:SAM-dependent methyltransferase